MNFLQAVAEVVETTKRPDKINIIRREINAAISFYCLDNNDFPRDFIEQSIPLVATAYTQGFSLTLLTRYRKVKYIKRGGTREFLTRLTDTEMYKGMDKCNKFYEVGSSINVSLSKLSSTLDIGYYTYPPILEEDDSFWLLDIVPFMIIDRACAAIFKDIGDEKSYSVHKAQADVAYVGFVRDHKSSQ